MNRGCRFLSSLAGGCILSMCLAGAQTSSSLSSLPENLAASIDPRIANRIASIKAIDNHAHPVLPPPDDEKDREFDALPVDNMEPETDLVAWRPDNPQLPAAWKALWGFDGAAPLDEAGMKRLDAARRRVKAREGQHYDEWVLNQAGIDCSATARVLSRRGVQSCAQFRRATADS